METPDAVWRDLPAVRWHDEQPPDERAERAEQRTHDYRVARARFCLATRVQPSEYDRMSVADIAVFAHEHNQSQTES